VRKILLIVLGLALLTPSFASAQLFRFGRGRGWDRGWDYGNRWNYPGYGWGYDRSGWGIGFNLGDGYYGSYSSWYPYYGNYYSSYPYYGTYSYSYPSYSYTYPGYVIGGTIMDGSTTANSSGSNIYQAGYSAPMNNVVRLEVVVSDPNAQLTIQGQPVSGTGTHRQFVSPPLDPNKAYTYTISVKSNKTHNGDTTRHIDVKAGSQYTVDFTSGERIPAPGNIDVDHRNDGRVQPGDTQDKNRSDTNPKGTGSTSGSKGIGGTGNPMPPRI